MAKRIGLFLTLLFIVLNVSAENRYKKILDELERKSIENKVSKMRVLYTHTNKPYGLAFEGVVEKGDFEIFEKYLKLKKGEISVIQLGSPGGNAFEAMKIGRLIRKLKLSTMVPKERQPAGESCSVEVEKKENCTCESACFLMFSAGVHRIGSVAGIHRMFLIHSSLKKMSSDNAANLQSKLTNQTRSYLSEMGVPQKYIEKAIGVSSKEMHFISGPDMMADFWGFYPDLKEWGLSKCGSISKLGLKLKAAKGQKKNEVFKQLKMAMECENELVDEITRKAQMDYFQLKKQNR